MAAVPVYSSQDGAYIIMDADSGRVVRMENPGIAVETSFPPGSILKLFATLYALEHKIISPAETVHCKGAVTIGGRRFECWKPSGHGPVNLYKALAYSCNIYFYHIGDRVDKPGFLEFLRSFGFGRTTGIDCPNEEPGKAPMRLDRRATVKLFAGVTRELEITPIQAAAAFAAIVNGGKLVRPYLYEKPGKPLVTGNLNIGPYLPHLERGMKEGAGYGTTSGYDSAAVAYAKTGTAPWVRGFRTHGWFAGYVPLQQGKQKRRLVALVFKVDGTGRKDALPAGIELAKQFKRRVRDENQVTVSLFSLLKPKRLTVHGRMTHLKVKANDEVIECRRLKARFSEGHGILLELENQPPRAVNELEIVKISDRGVLVLQAGSMKTREYPGHILLRSGGDYLEILNRVTMAEYLRGVIGNEMGQSLEALKAQAAASRTYAIKNSGRHSLFNFCDTTHCQHYTGRLNASRNVSAAVLETAGMVLTVDRSLCDVYYHSTCGGHTGGYGGVWSDAAIPYLKSINDEEQCKPSPHYRWTFRVGRELLFKYIKEITGRAALDIEISKVGADGWVKKVTLVFGDGTRSVMRGEEFHIYMGRRFGWGKFKSANFTMEKNKNRWVFKGRGLGHGVGMCQWGAYRRSRKGRTFPHILQTYFPGTTVGLY
jgi:stage II sporulation protein D